MKKIIFISILLCQQLLASEKQNLKLIKSVTVKIPEPSALSFSMDQESLLTVSDQNGMAYSLSLEGAVLTQHQTSGSDLEGIVTHDDLKGFCTVSERIREIQCYDQKWKLLKSKKIPFPGSSNAGFEGLSYNPLNRHFYIVNEKSPTSIIEINDELEIVKTHQFNHSKDLSDIYFDSIEQKFWIVSHESNMIFQTDLSFNIQNKYSIPEVVQAEGIAADSINKKIYIISDKDSKFFIFGY